jgi:hypothetical protein
VKVLSTTVERREGRVRLAAEVDWNGRRVRPYFAFPAEFESFLGPPGDAFVPSLLLPSMAMGEDLELAVPVSAALLGRIDRVQGVVCAMHRGAFRRVRVAAPAREATAGGVAAGGAVAALFSSGVDSFYTLFKWDHAGTPSDRITHLLFVRGLEQPLDALREADDALRRVREVAEKTGRTVVECETNLRSLFTLNYQLYYHGAALVSTALALSGGLRRLLVPASFSYGQMEPWGTHPTLDHLWSTEALEVLHDGCEARRVDKIARVVSQEPIALRYLRVCLENAGGPYNCGRCRKCARTMFALALVDALHHAPTFPSTSLRELAGLLARDDLPFLMELVDLARGSGRAEMIKIAERALRQRRRRDAVRALLETTPGLAGLLPAVRGIRRRLRARRGPLPAMARPPAQRATLEPTV